MCQDCGATTMQTKGIIKPFSAMPGPTRFPVIGTMAGMLSNFGQWHLLNEKRHRLYGPIWREQIPQFGDLVVIADPRGVKDVARAEGQTPLHLDTPIWLDYYRARNIPVGIIHANGVDWQRMRKAVDKPIMRPASIAREVPKIAEVAEDFVKRLGLVRLPKKNGLIPELDMELFKWALESSCSVLYDRRLGCMETTPPAMTTEFILAVQEVMGQMMKLLLLPPEVVRKFMPTTWERYLGNWDTIFGIAKAAVQEKTARGGQSLDTTTFIGSVLASQALSQEEIHSNVSELMMASVDTTAFTSQAVLYELARRPHIQEAIYKEIIMCLPDKTELITYNHLAKLTFLKAAIKEAQRLYPIAFNISRKLKTDQVICGYEVPKETTAIIALYPLGRNSNYYRDPCDFRPERWIRLNGGLPFDPFAFVPFGVGQRSCLGRRIANIELELMLAHLLRHYRLATQDNTYEMTTKFFLTPAKSLNLMLTPR